MKKIFSIAIDGPSGAGKSTIAKHCATEFGILYVDTGAIYRSVGLAAKRNNIGSKDMENVEKLLPSLDITMAYDETGLQRMFLNGEDVSSDIRLPEISIYASDVSAMPCVRAFLLELQRELARKNSVIMDGRDIATVVLPDADVKIFLTASATERATRRHLELTGKGIDTSFEEVLKNIEYRDKNDSSRAIAPLKPAEDSIIVDTTGYTLDESTKLLCKIIKEHLA